MNVMLEMARHQQSAVMYARFKSRLWIFPCRGAPKRRLKTQLMNVLAFVNRLGARNLFPNNTYYSSPPRA